KEGSNERINRFYGNLGDGCIFPKTVNELWSGGIAESVVYQIPDSEKYLSYPVDPQTCAQGDLYSIWLRFDGTGAHYRLQVEHESEIYWSLFSGNCENLELRQCGQGNLPSNLHAIAEKNYRLLLQKEGPFTGEINLEAIKLGTDLGKDEYDASYPFSIFPNPASEAINIHREVPLQESHSGIIYNSLGQEVQQFTMAAGQVDWSIPITALARGVYFVALSNAEGAVYYEQVLLH
ncbi:MAG: T9SS type A sorting domain-containing protein, partial [Bacteroidota bacterium]